MRKFINGSVLKLITFYLFVAGYRYYSGDGFEIFENENFHLIAILFVLLYEFINIFRDKITDKIMDKIIDWIHTLFHKLFR